MTFNRAAIKNREFMWMRFFQAVASPLELWRKSCTGNRQDYALAEVPDRRSLSVLARGLQPVWMFG